MQTFTVVLEVTVNAIESVSSAEVTKEIEALVENFEGGTVKVVSCDEE